MNDEICFLRPYGKLTYISRLIFGSFCFLRGSKVELACVSRIMQTDFVLDALEQALYERLSLSSGHCRIVMRS